MPKPTLKNDTSYPVLAINSDTAEQSCRDRGRSFRLRTELEEAARELIAARRSSAFSLWAREAHGLDALNQPALMTFVFVVAKRDAHDVAQQLRDALRTRWGEWAVQLEGEHCAVGDEERVFVGRETRKTRSDA